MLTLYSNIKSTMTEFDDKKTIDALMKRVEELNDTERQHLINSIKSMNTINKKREYTEEEIAEKKKAANEKRKETIARRKAEKLASGEKVESPTKKVPITDEEKAERKRIANEKRKATWARKKREREDVCVVEDTTSEEDNSEKSDANLKPQSKLIVLKPKTEVVKEETHAEEVEVM